MIAGLEVLKVQLQSTIVTGSFCSRMLQIEIVDGRNLKLEMPWTLSFSSLSFTFRHLLHHKLRQFEVI